MKYYIIHGTTDKNLVNILKSGYLETKTSKVNQIFTHLLYRGLPDQKNQMTYWNECCLILDKQILKDYPFYATNILGYYKNFLDAFNKDARNILVKSKGKLNVAPDLKILKEHIVKIMKERLKSQNTFVFSHEILFNKKIPLKKYCKCIIYGKPIIYSIYDPRRDTIYPKIIPKKLLLLASKLNIPIKYYYDYYGLDNLIDVIEK